MSSRQPESSDSLRDSSQIRGQINTKLHAEVSANGGELEFHDGITRLPLAVHISDAQLMPSAEKSRKKWKDYQYGTAPIYTLNCKRVGENEIQAL